MDDWRRYAAPAAFLLAVTVAVVLIRSGVESGHAPGGRALPPLPTASRTAAAATTTAKATPRRRHRVATRFWTVKPGDTFGVIASQTGVPVARLEQLNPNVSSTSLVIGQKVRIG